MFVARSRSRLLVGMAAVSAIAVAGCSSSKPTSQTSPSASSTTQSSSSPSTASSPATSPSASGGAPETITIGLFGTFGFKEAGLYDEYQKLHPNITIKEDDIEQSADYLAKLKTHLAAGSGLDDIQAIEIGFVGQMTANYADKFVDFNKVDNGAQIKSTFYPWKWNMATASGGQTIGLGTDAGPEAMCYRQDLLKAAGFPNDRATLDGQVEDVAGLHQLRQAVQGQDRKAVPRLCREHLQRGGLPEREAYDTPDGKPDVKNSPGVKNAWASRYAGRAGGHHREAQPVLHAVEPGLRQRRVRRDLVPGMDARLHHLRGRPGLRR